MFTPFIYPPQWQMTTVKIYIFHNSVNLMAISGRNGILAPIKNSWLIADSPMSPELRAMMQVVLEQNPPLLDGHQSNNYAMGITIKRHGH
jgi:hypothetical protein